MNQVRFSGLYKVQIQQSNNRSPSRASASNSTRDAIKDWSSKNNHQAATHFFVDYPRTEEQMKSAKDGFAYVHFPKPGQDYDVYVATNDKTENTADLFAAQKTKPTPSNLASDFDPKDQFVQKYQAQGNIGTLNIELDQSQKLKSWNITAKVRCDKIL